MIINILSFLDQFSNIFLSYVIDWLLSINPNFQ